jgi:hypothetical protein
MGTLTLTYGAASVAGLCALALLVAGALMQRFGVAPIPAAQGTSVPAAGQLVAMSAGAPNAHSTTTAVDRKADDRVLPRGRTL